MEFRELDLVSRNTYIRNRDIFLVSQVTDAFQYFLYTNYYLLFFSYLIHDLFCFYEKPNSSSFRYLVFLFITEIWHLLFNDSI